MKLCAVRSNDKTVGQFIYNIKKTAPDGAQTPYAEGLTTNKESL